MANPTEHDSETVHRPAETSRPLRVLVLDDDPGARAFVQGALRGVAQVIGQGIASSARRMLQYGRYDVLVLDLILSGTNGLKFLQHLPADRRPRRVVALTGWREGMAAARKFGVQAMLPKPCTAEALRQAVLETSQAPAPVPELNGDRGPTGPERRPKF